MARNGIAEPTAEAVRLFGRTLPGLVRGLRPDRVFFDRTRRARRLRHPPERWARPPKGFPPAHRHPSFEFCFVLAGRCPFLMGETRRQVRRGDMVVLPPESYHREFAAESCGPYRLLWLACHRQGLVAHSQEHLGGGRFGADALRVTIERLPEAQQTAETVDLELWEDRPGAFLRVQGLLLQLCGLAERAVAEGAHPGAARLDARTAPRKSEGEAVQRWRVEAAVEYVRDHFADSIDLGEVAARVGVAPGYMSALFTRSLGRSFTDFLASCRVAEAQRLLADSKLSVKEIAAKVGLENPFYFSRLFRKHTGLSPSQCRGRAAGRR